MAATCVNFIFESNLARIKDVLASVLSCVENMFPYISKSDLFDLRLVYNELLANAIIHGNQDDSTKKVELMIKLDNDRIFSVIKDEGSGFDFFGILESENSIDNLMESHGRGLTLARSLTEYINYNSSENEIEFHKRISRER